MLLLLLVHNQRNNSVPLLVYCRTLIVVSLGLNNKHKIASGRTTTDYRMKMMYLNMSS
jgi:hypothetical protein